MITQDQNKKQPKNSTFGERNEERILKENPWRQYNSGADFHAGDMQKSLEALALQTFPTDIDNCQAYQEAIIKSLTETLSPEVGVKDFWAKMAEAGCKKIQIENGHLYFYTSKKERIDITAYTQPIVFELHSSFYDQRELERKQRIEAAHTQLQDLLKEIGQNRYKN